MNTQLFLSYRRGDSSGHVGRLHDDLAEVFGDEAVFMDVSDLEGGRQFPAAINAAISAASVFVVVIGPNWLARTAAGHPRLDDPQDWVRREIAAALALNKPVLPVLVGGATLPRPDDLPPDVARFTEYGAIEVSDRRWAHDVGLVLDSLDSLGLSPPIRTPFLGESCGGRVEVRTSWLAPGAVASVSEQVVSFLSANGISARRSVEGTFTITGGSKTRTRLLGLVLTNPHHWPIHGKARITKRASRTQVELMVCEDWGVGVLDPASKGRYEMRLEAIAQGLRRATGG